MLNHLLPTEDPWTWMALDICVKATLLLAVAAIVALFLGQASAALRHRVWALSFIALLLLPLASLALPGLAWRIIPGDWRVVPETGRTDVATTDLVGLPATVEGEVSSASSLQLQPKPSSDGDAMSNRITESRPHDAARSLDNSVGDRNDTDNLSGKPTTTSAPRSLRLVWLLGMLV